MKAIYMKLGRDKHECVLLTDGAWANEKSCNRPDDIVKLKPVLFATVGGAKNFMHKHGISLKRANIRKYQGLGGA